MSQQNTNTAKPGMNQQPQTGVLGAHPVGVSVGAIGAGAAAGAAGGAIGGPVGVVAGAAVGAVVGAVAGNAAAEAINPTTESKSRPAAPVAL